MKCSSLAAIMFAGICSTASAGSLKTLYNFTGGSNGANPESVLTTVNGTLYGTTPSSNPPQAYAVAYSFNPATSTYLVIHTFNSTLYGDPTSGLTFLGNKLYGETGGGGDPEDCQRGQSEWCGTVFSIDTQTLDYTTVHNFESGDGDGSEPMGGLTILKGNLYGVTEYGGTLSKNSGLAYGTIFEVNPSTNSESLLFTFNSNYGAGGANPVAPLLTVGTSFYGSTQNGGSDGFGTVFKIGTSGKQEKVLYNFSGQADGSGPAGSLAYRNKQLYGTTSSTIFDISITGTEVFSVPEASGYTSPQQLVQVGSDFYGVTFNGGASGYGSVYKVNATSGGITTLYSFTGGSDGRYLVGGLLYSAGVLYGTTAAGGSGYGTIFSYKP